MTAPSEQLKLATFAVCDDIRNEEHGKLTLVGYYGRSIRIATLPAILPKLCFMIQFERNLAPGSKLQISLLSPGGSILMTAPDLEVPSRQNGGPLIPDEYRYAQVVFQIAPMPLNEEGAYRIEVASSDGATTHASFYVAVDASLAKPK